MKGKISKLLLVGVAFVLVLSNVLCVSAAENTIVSAKFDTAGEFVAMGDIDNDGSLASPDLTLLRKRLLKSEVKESKYYDANGDTFINIIDLVRLKKYIGANNAPTKIQSKALVIDGTAYYTGEFVSLLKANTEYQISYNFTSDKGIALTLKGVAEADVNFNSKAGTNQKYYSHVFKTGENLTADSGLELIISGKGTIDNIVISEITDSWTDSDRLEQGSNDIF